MADLRGFQGGTLGSGRDLANRWFQPLTHVSGCSFPRDSAAYRQLRKREKRGLHRFAVAHQVAQSVRAAFRTYLPRRTSSASTAARMKSERFSRSTQAASMRANVPAVNRAGVCSSLIFGRPTLAGLADISFCAKPCILLISPIDVQSDITYVADIRYGGKSAMPYRTKFIDPDNRREPKTEHFCARCHKDLKPGQLFRVMHLVDGGPWAIHPEDEAAYDKPAADMGDWPVGMDCAKRIGLEFTRDNAGWLS